VQYTDGTEIVDSDGNCQSFDIALLQADHNREDIDVQQCAFRPLEIYNRCVGVWSSSFAKARFAFQVFRDEFGVGTGRQKIGVRRQIGSPAGSAKDLTSERGRLNLDPEFHPLRQQGHRPSAAPA
jgi:hypothetical protein